MEQLNALQSALLEKLLSVEFDGVFELRRQLKFARVQNRNVSEKFASFAINVDASSAPRSSANGIPVEGLAKDDNDADVEFLLFVEGGYMSELEVVKYTEHVKLDSIEVSDIKVMTRDQRREYEKT